MRRSACLIGVVLAFGGCGADDPPPGPPLPEQIERLDGSPPELAKLHRQANELLPGGVDEFEKRIRSLRGFPVVVNKWASWCGPCRAEFPHFQEIGSQRGKKVAFLAVNSNDNDDAAREFLDEFPVSYPSYKDGDLKIATLFKGPQAFPATAFYDSKGELVHVKFGQYKSEADLNADIDLYAK